MQNILEADSIRKDFGDKQVLTDIFIKCQTGDIIGLLGRNGSGKSTLLKILFGTLFTDYKHIAINGDILEQPFKVSGNICYLHQDNFLPKNMTVKKVLQMLDSRLDNSSILHDEVLSKVINTKIRDLSGGESRYLEVKIILHLDSKFVLLDEPFNGVSPIHIELVKEMIKSQSANKGIILTDHDYTNVLDVANKYMILFDGGLKTLKSKQDFIYWGYIPENKI
jgi:lipopolysaccharide export system ATP-binding protein